jgi:hypothetical protein
VSTRLAGKQHFAGWELFTARWYVFCWVLSVLVCVVRTGLKAIFVCDDVHDSHRRAAVCGQTKQARATEPKDLYKTSAPAKEGVSAILSEITRQASSKGATYARSGSAFCRNIKVLTLIAATGRPRLPRITAP